MKLVVTGGGTGGHVYPAIQIAQSARADGDRVLYFGARRGQEVGVATAIGIPLVTYPAQPLYSVRTVRGLRALTALSMSVALAMRALRKERPAAVFSTGGYSAAPTMAAARRLRIPLVIHEQNSIPGRSNRLFAPYAFRVGTTFHRSENEFPGACVERVGLPVRSALLNAEPGPAFDVLAVGGSQGARAINDVVVLASERGNYRWRLIAGPSLFAEVRERGSDFLHVDDLLDAAAMGAAMRAVRAVVARAGASTMTEVAALGLPSVLIPLPTAFADHQTENAREFADLGAAMMLPQERATPESLLAAVAVWMKDAERRERAKEALQKWYVPDATERIREQIRSAATRDHNAP